MTDEFKEIGHAGGKVTLSVWSNEHSQRGYQIHIRHESPVPVVMIALYALPPGIPIESLNPVGWGEHSKPPSVPGCVAVYIMSDSQGKFGHNCPRCNGYWRSGPWPNVCPYCATNAQSHEFLSAAQLRYVRHYCTVLVDALDSMEVGERVIDMDEVADAVGKDGDKPAFYVSEQSQQHKFTCRACEEFNDILGRYGYCSLCGTRNDAADFEDQVVPTIRERLNGGNAPEDCLRDAVASFDSFVAQIAKQLVDLVPMTEYRKHRLSRQRFHNLEDVRTVLKDWFDIDVRANMTDAECSSVARMFHRRHVYEHNGGEVDQKYLDDSGDTSVRLKQRIRETQQDVHGLLSSLFKMAHNIHRTFHELFPPIPEPIKALEEKKARMEKFARDSK